MSRHRAEDDGMTAGEFTDELNKAIAADDGSPVAFGDKPGPQDVALATGSPPRLTLRSEHVTFSGDKYSDENWTEVRFWDDKVAMLRFITVISIVQTVVFAALIAMLLVIEL
jgi:hypothetical protein